MVRRPKIKVTKNGPYIVTGGIPLIKMVIETDEEGHSLSWREVETYPPRESYALCRCGQSSKKPYCDGSHVLKKFIGEEIAEKIPYLETVRNIVGPELKLTDRRDLCVGAAFCVRAGNIWNLTVNSDNLEYRQTAIEQASNCPSGRLVVWDNNNSPIEPDLKPSIAVTEDQDGVAGPLWVRGGIEIESEDGYIYEKRNRVTLCQCGKSKNKPYCDISHLE